uniref:Histone-lysine N-methyltransferase, H3 lysine-9 specific SUVH6 n=1 Tax=Noccaea caerulescens TaxID=107243 RepID=A0A1J3E9H4_NOCCA
MSFGMGVMENKVHKESSKVSSSSSNGNGNVSTEEKLGGNVLQNGIYNNTASTRLLKFKRRKVFAVRDFPPGCGSIAMRLRSSNTETKKEIVESSEAAKVECSSDKEEEKLREQQKCNDMDVAVAVAVAVTAGVESNGVNKPEPEQMKDGSDEMVVVAAEDGNHLENAMVEPVDVQPLSTMHKDDDVAVIAGDESNGANNVEPEPMKEDSDEGMFAPENIPTMEPVDVQPLSVCLPYGGGSIIKTKQSKPLEPKPIHAAGRRKAKKGVANHAPLKVNKTTMSREYGEGSKMKKSSERDLYSRKRASPDTTEDSPDRKQRKTLQVMLPPWRPGGSSGGDGIRNKVKETLRLFHGTCRKLMQEEEAKPKLQKKKNFRVDFEASKILKSKGIIAKSANQVMGTVPGVEVGDEFQYRMELNILGVHKPSQGGIDSMKVGDENLATSIVCSGGYDDDLDNSDVLTYTGQGGNVMIKSKKGEEKKEPEDQKLITGNLALANSVRAKNPVRVIKGHKKAVLETAGDNKRRNYVYDGLYVVEEFWQETGSHGKLVFKYKLRRLPGQPELSWRVVKKSKKSQIRPGLCRLDISEGKERLPISAINEIDDEKPPSFIYTAEMIYPDWCRPVPPKGCGCTKGCTETNKCACVAKNGGEIPYNYDGAIVSAKNLIFECGPLCKCPPSCYLRVTQRGIKFPLEIFKTESRGWGVRSLSSIPSGSFICEYVGELLEDKEAERRTGNDEYLFDIGNRYENPLAEGMSKLMPETRPSGQQEEDDDETSGGFTIDAAKKGNVGRFINHSCSPNLYAQNVLYDHEDTRIPHVMFFAMDNIPPLQELTYHYNYMIDQVRDSKGNIKKKICYCGSSDCTGRLY